MFRRSDYTVLPLLSALVVLTAACGDSLGPADGGLTDNIDFPTLAANVIQEFCIRGAIVPSASPSGSIEGTDCNVNGALFETYRVRVGETTDTDFEVESDFDSVLELVRVEDVSSPTPSITHITTDDNSGDGVDALIRFIMQPNTEYWIAVGGRDPMPLGSYTLRVREN